MSAKLRSATVIDDTATSSMVLAPPYGAVPIVAWLRARRILAELRGMGRSPPGRGGPPEPADQRESIRSIFNDPNFWMLMVH
jgi:hypothetical protein